MAIFGEQQHFIFLSSLVPGTLWGRRPPFHPSQLQPLAAHFLLERGFFAEVRNFSASPEPLPGGVSVSWEGPLLGVRSGANPGVHGQCQEFLGWFEVIKHLHLPLGEPRAGSECAAHVPEGGAGMGKELPVVPALPSC